MQIILSILILSYSYLSSAQDQIYLFGAISVKFGSFPKEKITVSSHCINSNKVADCYAIRRLSKVSFKKIERPKFGGLNPGAMICEQQLNGLVIVGIDKISQNENSFCKLADGSIIDNGTLISYGIKNDRAQEREPNNLKSK